MIDVLNTYERVVEENEIKNVVFFQSIFLDNYNWLLNVSR